MRLIILTQIFKEVHPFVWHVYYHLGVTGTFNTATCNFIAIYVFILWVIKLALIYSSTDIAFSGNGFEIVKKKLVPICTAIAS